MSLACSHMVGIPETERIRVTHGVIQHESRLLHLAFGRAGHHVEHIEESLRVVPSEPGMGLEEMLHQEAFTMLRTLIFIAFCLRISLYLTISFSSSLEGHL